MERLVRFFVERGKAIAILPAFSLFISAVFLGFYGVYLSFEILYKVFTEPEYLDTAILSLKPVLLRYAFTLISERKIGTPSL